MRGITHLIAISLGWIGSLATVHFLLWDIQVIQNWQPVACFSLFGVFWCYLAFLVHLGLATLAMIVTRPDERLQKLCWGYFAFSRTRLKWLHDNLQIDKGLRFEGKIAQAVHYLKRQNRHCFFDGPGTGQNLGGFTGTGWIAGLLWWVWIGPSHNNVITWHPYLVYILVLVRGLWSRNSNFGLQLQASRCFGSSSNLQNFLASTPERFSSIKTKSHCII